MVAVGKTTSHFAIDELHQVVDRLEKLTSTLTTAFGMVIYDYSHAENRLVRIVSASPIKDAGYLADLDRSFPALTRKAKRTFDEAVKKDRVGISPIDLTGGGSYFIVATPENVTVFGAKTQDTNLNHKIINSMIRIVAEVCEETDLLPEMLPRKIVEFQPPEIVGTVMAI